MKHLTADQKAAIIAECGKWWNPASEQLFHGALKYMTALFHPVKKRTIQELWFNYRRKQTLGIPAPSLASNMKGNVGRKSKLTPELKDEYIRILQEYANIWIRATQRLIQACSMEKLECGLALRLFSRGTVLSIAPLGLLKLS